MKLPSRVPFCIASSWSAGEMPTGVPPSAVMKLPLVGEAGRRRGARAAPCLGGALGLLRGVDVAGLVREEQQHLHALVLGVEVLAAQLRVVDHLGADLGAA